MTAPSLTRPAPIAIGGLGGSGTRVFAASLRDAGFDLGPTLNGPLDNLWFTVLFKRALWAQERPDPNDIAVSVDLFCRAMTSGLAENMISSENDLIQQLIADLPPNGSWQCGAHAAHAAALIASGVQPGGQSQPWGWKEPNTHLFLPQLDQHIDGFRYIHVLRNGLDMAFSDNTWQADHWAHHYDLAHEPGSPAPLHQLRYWLAANRRALDYGKHQMPGRFLAVEYDDFCIHPAQHWPRLQQFLGKPADTPIPQGLIAPSSIGRNTDHDLSIFPNDLLDAVHELHFEVEELTKSG
ncbi:MAG: sulfotransferase [Sulfitobacter sp.]